MISVARKLRFESAHRVVDHESKCKNPHGHSYIAWIHARAPELDNLGRIIDFGVLKEKIGTWLDNNFDHAFIYWENDPIYSEHFKFYPLLKSFALPYNPTAENIGKYLLDVVCPSLLTETNVEVFKIVIWE